MRRRKGKGDELDGYCNRINLFTVLMDRFGDISNRKGKRINSVKEIYIFIVKE